MFEKSEKEHRSSLKTHKVCNRIDAHKCSFVQTLQQARMFASIYTNRSIQRSHIFSVYITQKAAFIHREMITLRYNDSTLNFQLFLTDR